MEKRIITVSREFGSGGRSVGKALAKRLGWKYYDKELVKAVAEKTGFGPRFIEERGEFSVGKSLLSYALAGQGMPGVMNGMSASDFLWCMQREVILKLAEEGGCVIVGRCADYILRTSSTSLSTPPWPIGPTASSACMANRSAARSNASRTRTKSAG